MGNSWASDQHALSVPVWACIEQPGQGTARYGLGSRGAAAPTGDAIVPTAESRQPNPIEGREQRQMHHVALCVAAAQPVRPGLSATARSAVVTPEASALALPSFQ